ncbi:MAG TPA: DNA polymerase I [Longimicrobiales bacterium]|nr:DNA polymerase I [Longimicrobiales bacterium]
MVDIPQKSRPRLFLIDGYALIYRAFFAMISRPLTTSSGENTSAAFGMVRFLRKVLDEFDPDYLGVVLDAGNSQRTEIYPDYKATREKMPDELAASLPRIRALIEAFAIPVLELEDHEADDVIGTLAARAGEAGVETVIVSGDKDFYQLIGPDVFLLNPGRGGAGAVDEEWVDERNASERLGVPPGLVVDYLALIGDSSDNVPGAPGIGPKTAIKLLNEFGDLDAALEAAPGLSAKRAREALTEHRDDVLLSRRLVTIQRDLPVTLDLESLAVAEPDVDRLRELFVELEFHSLVRELGEGAKPAAETATRYATATLEALEDVAARARAAGVASIEVPAADGGGPLGIAVAVAEGEAWYAPLAHRRPGELALGDAVRNLPSLPAPEMGPLRAMLEDGTVAKVGHDLKGALTALRGEGVELAGLTFDTMLASYVLEPGRRDHAIPSLALEHLGLGARSVEDVTGSGRDRVALAECDVEAVRDLACERADVALRLREPFSERLEAYHQTPLYRDIELPLIPVLADMETAGIRIDLDFFRELSERYERELSLLGEDIHAEAGGPFNINSTPQLREVLFDRLELPVLKRTKTGPSTDATVLEELAAQGHTLPLKILEFRKIEKLRNTYVDALPRLVRPETGRIHTSFNQAVAATGRLSSSDPNLQNIPIRTELGAEIRKGFVPADGCLFVSVDYSQIELRILAHLSGDPGFVEAFRAGRDIHRETAARVFEVPSDEVTSQMREAAKTINFATIYGIGPYALGRQLGVPYQEAKRFIEQYFERFADVRAYLDSQIEAARKQGWVETLVGRRRYIPEIRAKNHNIRQFGERAATNAPVQGSAADIIKLAMIDIHRTLSAEDGAARMLLQVHDELVFEVDEARSEAFAEEVRRRMEAAFDLDVPLVATAGIGADWYSCKA